MFAKDSIDFVCFNDKLLMRTNVLLIASRDSFRPWLSCSQLAMHSLRSFCASQNKLGFCLIIIIIIATSREA